MNTVQGSIYLQRCSFLHDTGVMLACVSPLDLCKASKCGSFDALHMVVFWLLGGWESFFWLLLGKDFKDREG